MTDDLWLFEKNAADYSRNPDPCLFWGNAFREFGKTAAHFHERPRGDQGLLTYGDRHLKALCGEALLLPVAERSRMDSVIGVGTVSVGSCCAVAMPTYEALRQCEVAAAIFPMCREEMVGLGRVWAIRGNMGNLPPDSPFPLQGGDAILASAREGGTRLYADTPGVLCDGESWQLAAWLALHVLLTDQPPDVRINLASRWLVTGTVVKNDIGFVEIKKKPNVGTDRHWIIPAGCEHNFRASCKVKEVPFHPLHEVHAALSLVCGGIRIRNDEPAPFPKRIGELHVFLTEANDNPPDALLSRATDRRICCMGVSKERWVAFRKRFGHPNVTHLPAGNLIARCTDHVRNIAMQGRDKDVWIDISNVPWPQQMAVETQVRLGGANLMWWDADTQRYRKYWYWRGVPHLCDLTGV